jgi:MazG family protein
MINPPDTQLPPLAQLRQIMAQLRGPGGCPWDHEQTHRTLRGSLIEEAYEVVAAIEKADDENLCEELGDLLLQVVFHAQIAQEEGRFDLDAVALGITQKLVRRHPHVFGEETVANAAAVLTRWDEIKRTEKGTPPASLLDGLTEGLPALLHADKVQKKAAKVGFDWSELPPVMEKVREELAEVEAAVASGDRGRLEEEAGDLLFAAVNLIRHLRVEAETALRSATGKFVRRFQAVERLAKERQLVLETLTLPEMDLLWDEVKGTEAPPPDVP